MAIDQQFQHRADKIMKQGFGLSVDVYSPNLLELMSRFDRADCRPSYLEIFRAAPAALKTVSRQVVEVPFAYHGDGLWITQPDFLTTPSVHDEIDDIISQLLILKSPWLNHECAAKQMAGYSFGTYLPPLYTAESAEVVAGNIATVQRKLDEGRSPGEEFGPLFLLELPPLTYFMAGTMTVPSYFRLVTELTPCGLVLDVGHLWTVYRYSAARRELTLEAFVERFLDEFPLERVIEIHVAGLAPQAAAAADLSYGADREWIDSHAAPIPDVCWTMLEQILAHRRLYNLRGIALEVDTKPIEQILQEFLHARRRLSPAIDRCLARQAAAPDAVRNTAGRLGARTRNADGADLLAEYAQYAQIVSGRQPPTGRNWQEVAADASGLHRYVHEYLPHEILHWGGDLTGMFPETSRCLSATGVSIDEFVSWWFRVPRPVEAPYDFFQLKIDRLVEFVAERAPSLLAVARLEADSLRSAYADANAHIDLGPVVEPSR